ncbi:MAG: bifunctional diguanylate cyclase/phosphodiesterase [Mobilitalea sp.]
MRIKSSMRNKLILAIFIGCLIPYFLGGIYLKVYIEKWLYNNSIDNTNQLISQVGELIDKSLVIDMKEEVTLLSSLDSVKNANQDINNYTEYDTNTFKYKENNTEEVIEDHFRVIKDSHKTTHFIFLGTENGGYMEYPRFSPSQSYDPRIRPWYTDTINQSGVVISEPYLTNVSKEMVISFTKQIETENAIIGVVGVSVELEELTNNINKIKIGESGYVIVMSPKQRFLVSPSHPERILKTAEELGLDSLKASEIRDENTFEAKLDGFERVFNVVTSAESGFYVISVVNKSEILHKAEEITNILIVIYLITFMLIFIIVFQILKHITEPILEISSVINHMTDFDFDFNDKPHIEKYTKKSDEIGIVATALVEMHDNFIELMEQVNNIDDEIKNIDIEKNNEFKLELSKNNPFSGVIGSMNILMDKIYSYFNQLKATNHEIVGKNDLLTASEEELTAQLEEIDQQKEYINFLAFHDFLTGLPNRRSFVDFLTNKINLGHKGAVILLDIDDFKGINDILGHVFGDRVLETIAKRLENEVDDKIFVSRFGGDEFLILIETDETDCDLSNYVKKISHIFDDKIHIDDNDIEIKFSMGISLFPEDSIDVNQLVMNADLAMYAVKNTGKNGYKYFDTGMMDYQIKKSKIEVILRNAIENDGFKMVYQPIVNVETGQVYGYEALLRLKEYNISPAEFIEVAEKNGSIIKIGRIVTQKVVEQLSKWRKSGLDIKPVSINFSANQLLDSGYIQFIHDILNKNNIEADLLEIEITENIFLENKQVTLAFLKQLKEMGIKISIDDFGTGYSSLNYLTFLPVDKIKLDRSLNMKFLEIENIKVMDSMISLVHSLGFTVIAEGIEIIDQVKRLKIANCDYIQGFYFSKPLDEEQIPGMHTNIYNT